jgi:hypothetical protein
LWIPGFFVSTPKGLRTSSFVFYHKLEIGCLLEGISVVEARRGGASIQASFRGQNLGLEGFLNGLKQFWKVLFQKDDQV